MRSSVCLLAFLRSLSLSLSLFLSFFLSFFLSLFLSLFFPHSASHVTLQDPLVVTIVPKLIELFLAQLRDPDSYIYLTAVDGFVTLVNLDASAVLPPLLLLFRFASPRI